MLSTLNTIIFLPNPEGAPDPTISHPNVKFTDSTTMPRLKAPPHPTHPRGGPKYTLPFPRAKPYQVDEILTRRMRLPQSHTSFTHTPSPSSSPERKGVSLDAAWLFAVPPSAERSGRQKGERKITRTAGPHRLNFFGLGLFSTCQKAYYKIGDKVSESVATDMFVTCTGNIRAAPQKAPY